MGRQHFSRNSNPHLYVATAHETAEGLFEVLLAPLVGWLVSGEESPNFERFHLVAALLHESILRRSNPIS